MMNTTGKIILGLSVITLFAINDVFAQGGYFEDALRYSQYQSSGSARIMGIAGTQNSLGGDISNIHANPAGLGFFQRSEFGFTGSYGNWGTETVFLNQVQKESTNNFALPNLGVVLSQVKEPLELGDWRGGSFGISLNRSRLFTNKYGYYSNSRGSSSLLDFYVEDYNNFGEPAVGDPAGLPLDVGIIYDENNVFQKDFDYALGNPFQDEFIESEGSLTQISLAYGGNLKNKLFLGGSVGITSVNFLSTKTFNEEFRDDENVNSLYYSLQENLLQNGTGFNVNVGVIYKPQDNLNLGFSFHSPTWSRLEEEFDADIFAEYYDLNGAIEFEESAISDIYLTTINLRSPMKLSAGATYFFNKNGFISGDIDYVDYSSMHLSSPDISMEANNTDIKNSAAAAINYRAGAEYRFDMFRVRAGAAFYGDPLDDQRDRTMVQFSGGVGVRLARMYVDLGIVQSNFQSYYSSYPGAELATTDHSRLTGLLTLGFNF